MPNFLVIRDEQMDALEDQLVRGPYEETLVAHLRRDGELTGGRDDDALRVLARDGMRRAKQLGATLPESYSQFVLLMLQFGPDFLDDPAHGWARVSLDDSRNVRGDARIGALVAAAVQALRTTPPPAPDT